MRKNKKNWEIITRLSCFLFTLMLLLKTTMVMAETKVSCDYGIKFELESCWGQDTFNTDAELLDLKFVNNDNEDILLIEVADFYAMLDESDKKGVKRSECDNSIFDTKSICEMVGDEFEVYDVYLEENGNNEFFVIEASNGIMTVEFDFIFCNGYMVQYQWWGGGRADYSLDSDDTLIRRDGLIQQHRDMLSSLDLSSIQPTVGLVGWQGLILSFAVTIFSYLLVPVVIRLKRKLAYEKKHATKIALLNSILVGLIWLVISVLLGNDWTPITATFYFFINRYILGTGDKPVEDTKEMKFEEVDLTKEVKIEEIKQNGTEETSTGEKIAILRKQCGLTQKQLAEYLQVSTGTVAEWESGELDLTVENMIGIAKFFDVSLDYLVLGKNRLYDE